MHSWFGLVPPTFRIFPWPFAPYESHFFKEGTTYVTRKIKFFPHWTWKIVFFWFKHSNVGFIRADANFHPIWSENATEAWKMHYFGLDGPTKSIRVRRNSDFIDKLDWPPTGRLEIINLICASEFDLDAVRSITDSRTTASLDCLSK